MAEQRLIDANEAIEKINGLCVDGNENWIGTENRSFIDHADVIDILSSIPTVDAVPVVHGGWLETQEPMGWDDVGGIECSNCHESWIVDEDCGFDDLAESWKYCSNCGAKMDGGNENE